LPHEKQQREQQHAILSFVLTAPDSSHSSTFQGCKAVQLPGINSPHCLAGEEE